MYRSNSQNFLRVMYVSTFVALFAFSGIVSCNEGSHTRDIKISITKAGQDFVGTIENISDHDVKISKLLSTDPIIGSIHFIVKEDGLRLPLMAQINSPMPSASSYLELYPGPSTYLMLSECTASRTSVIRSKLCMRTNLQLG